MSPFWDCSFFEFCGVFLQRIALWVSGALSSSDITSDELQFVVLMLIGLSCSLLGPFLVLKKMTMLANSLSHTILIGIVFVFLLAGQSLTTTLSGTSLFIAAGITALVTTFLTQFFTKTLKLQEDASIGLVFTGLFALGIILVTLFSKNAHFGSEIIMGNVDALHVDDLQLAFSLFVANGLLITLFFKQYQLISFDESFAKTLKIATGVFNYFFMMQIAASSMGAFRAVGVLLVLAFLVGPYLTAALFSKRLKMQIVLSMAIATLCSFLGVATSRHLLSVYDCPVSTGGLVVCFIGLIYGISIVFRKGRLRKTIKEL